MSLELEFQPYSKFLNVEHWLYISTMLYYYILSTFNWKVKLSVSNIVGSRELLKGGKFNKATWDTIRPTDPQYLSTQL